MKAKEYAERLIKAEDKSQELGEIFLCFYRDIGLISTQRHIQSNKALRSVIDELDNKWKTFSRMVNKKLGAEFLKEDGFIELAKKKDPLIEMLLRIT